MADVNKETDGPTPYSAEAFDFTLLPDYDNDFVLEEELAEFQRALAAPENSPSTEDLASPSPAPRTFITALNDWRPIHQRVRRRKKHRKAPRRGKDETREGFVYVLLKWPLLIVVFGWLLFLSIAYGLTRLYIYLYEHWVTWRGRRENLRKQLQSATTYEQWVESAKELDTYLGNDAWKETDEYAYYDSKTIRRAHDQMHKLRCKAEAEESGKSQVTEQHRAVEELRGLVEACVKNNFVGFENPRLYSETYYGTKNLVQKFVDEVDASLAFLLGTTQLDVESKRALFRHLSTNFGRTALCLSGGATFAYYHFGVAKALMDAALLPEVITGTSGGALVAALIGTRTDDELKKLLVPSLAHRITACHDGVTVWVQRWWKTGARFDSVDWGKRCAWFTRGSTTFREAYERTGRILNVSCVPSDPHSPTILANYLTSPDCVIWSAVLASAAVPGILNPVVLMKKNKDGTLSPYSFGHKWKDGSLRTDIPLKALNLHFNVRFSIVSQVNPHINLFFFSSRGTVGRPVTHRRGRGWRGGFLGSALEQYIKLDMNKWLKVLRHLELLPRPMGQDWSEIWLQRFSGTITIWPKSILSDFYHILSDPTPSRLARMIHVGQQSAFPKLKFIANRAKIERKIHQGRRQYRSGTAKEGELTSVLSEDEIRGLLQRTKSDGNGTAYVASDSDSTATEPEELALAFTSIRRSRKAPVNSRDPTSTNPNQLTAPDSPSLGKRLSGWWSSLSPHDTHHSKSHLRPPPTASSPTSTSRHLLRHDRPSSMFELRPPREQTAHDLLDPAGGSSSSDQRPGSFLKELRRQTRVFVDDESDDDPTTAFGDARRRYDTKGGNAEPGARGAGDDYADMFGDDEDEGEGDSGGAGIGLGLEKEVAT